MSARFIGEPEFRHDARERIGVLLANLGTPQAPESGAVRRYLAEFLSDPRVIEAPRALWWLVLHGVILRLRPRRSAAAYAKVWTAAGSPLLEHSRRQREALAAAFEARAPGRVEVALAMRYGEPSIASALARLREAGVRRLIVLPLYPQYSATTTASTFDGLAAALARVRWIPELRFVTGYHDHPAYVEAVAAGVREAWQRNGRAERLLFSFHGLPRRYFEAGDPYFCQCHKSARLVAERLQLDDGEWALSFQSRVGREPWLEPYTDVLLGEWARAGVGRVQVLCPGFAADCLETLEEIAMQDAADFLAAGGGALEYIPALNERDQHLALLVALIEERIGDWLARAEPDRERRRERARALGATR